MSTWFAKQSDFQSHSAQGPQLKKQWWLIDAKGQNLGRLATQIAVLLRGKHKPEFTPHVDTGDFVVVVNSGDVTMTGDKWLAKKYYRRSRYFGSLREFSATEMREKDSSLLLREAVWGMLPKNKMSRNIIKKLKIFNGAEHPHSAQSPTPYNPKS